MRVRTFWKPRSRRLDRLALEEKVIQDLQERVPVRFVENQNLEFLDVDNTPPFAQQEFLDPPWSANDDIGALE